MSTSPILSAASRVVSSGITLKTSRLTLGILRQYGSNASNTSSTPGLNDANLYGTGPNGCPLVAVVADLLDVFLGDDPTGAGRTRVIGQEVGPRLLELEAYMPSVGVLARCHPVFDHFRRGAAI